MTGVLFEELVKTRDSSFLINNCPAHPEIKNLTNINLIFLPLNTTSVLQPMDKGVIQSFKAHYRKKVVRLCTKAVESNKPLSKISTLQVMKHLVSSWNAVSKETIVNCFKKSNISQSNQQAAVNDDDDPFKSLQEDLEKLHELDTIQPNISAESFPDLDIKLLHLLFSLMTIISSPKLLKGRMKRAKMIKIMKKVGHQRVLQLMKLKMRWKRCKTFPCSARAGAKPAPLYCAGTKLALLH